MLFSQVLSRLMIYDPVVLVLIAGSMLNKTFYSAMLIILEIVNKS